MPFQQLLINVYQQELKHILRATGILFLAVQMIKVLCKHKMMEKIAPGHWVSTSSCQGSSTQQLLLDCHVDRPATPTLCAAETVKSLEMQVLVAKLGLLAAGAKARSKSQLAELLLPRLLDPNDTEVGASAHISKAPY